MISPSELELPGLGKYAELFAAHGIDVDLADLTDGISAPLADTATGPLNWEQGKK